MEDSRPVSYMASVTQNLSMPGDERDMEEDLPTEELEQEEGLMEAELTGPVHPSLIFKMFKIK